MYILRPQTTEIFHEPNNIKCDITLSETYGHSLALCLVNLCSHKQHNSHNKHLRTTTKNGITFCFFCYTKPNNTTHKIMRRHFKYLRRFSKAHSLYAFLYSPTICQRLKTWWKMYYKFLRTSMVSNTCPVPSISLAKLRTPIEIFWQQEIRTDHVLPITNQELRPPRCTMCWTCNDICRPTVRTKQNA